MKWETALWMVACFLFESLPRGQPDTTCHAFAGETVILPCTAISPGEVMLSNSMLYWQIDSVLVHFFHNGQDSLEFQDKHYQGRTSLFLDQMKHGNFSLKLSNVQLADTAEYACIYKQTGNYPNKTQKFKIKLIVSGQSQISSRSPTDAPCLAVLPISFHLLLSLGIWHW
ncbi:V-set domain-containing T-cell activation inhibitor 1-like isoform X2 [Calypte anna]|uniref:V-set domain-containing T-cell activation inhibitor 1-like isoform X2 n=1 Tax=Calypte anna TaxID=9244 RepID=UPI0011C3867D|nr:V-set domain-containing T-cell activation inhibitor 1-like isoform X2 [Calypte anna]